MFSALCGLFGKSWFVIIFAFAAGVPKRLSAPLQKLDILSRAWKTDMKSIGASRRRKLSVSTDCLFDCNALVSVFFKILLDFRRLKGQKSKKEYSH